MNKIKQIFKRVNKIKMNLTIINNNNWNPRKKDYNHIQI